MADNDRLAPLWKDTELWSLRQDVNVEMEPDFGLVRIRGRWGDFTVQRPSPLTREVLSRMSLGPISLRNAVEGHEWEAATELAVLFDQLQPLIVRSLHLPSGQPLLSVVPLTVQARFHPVPLATDVPVRMSTFATLSSDGEMYRIESPLALHRVVVHRAEAMALIAPLASPITLAELTATMPEADGLAADVLAYLAAAGMVVQAQPGDDQRPVFGEECDPALTGWSAVDMMFHTRSTLGRHDHNFGITYPAGVTSPPEPVTRPQAAEFVELHRPRWEELCRTDPPLTVALEGRRSMRGHAAPVTVTQLGELLYRTARVRSLIPAGSGRELSDRPYPSGGACYELEFYVTAGNCSGLAPGVYHYDPLGHRLEPAGAGTADGAGDELLGCARVAATMHTAPPVLITMTARFRRLSWKYEGLAYRLVLMHVGVIVQNLYLACTAMRLAPCAIGSVSIEAAARAFGTDWRTEPCVGQFIVGGSSDDEPGRDPDQWLNVNDAEWADLARAALR